MSEKNAAAVAASEAPAAANSPTDDVVEAWFRDTFHNRAIETSEYNRIFAAKDDLKARLRAGA